MIKFKDLSEPIQVKNYLEHVLSRRNKKETECFLYHYTSIKSIAEILKSRTFLINDIHNMNDKFEGKYFDKLGLGVNLAIASFSRTEENLAMYNMYAGGKDSIGACLKIRFDDLQKTIDKANAARKLEIYKFY